MQKIYQQSDPHGQLEVVDEMDITRIRKKACPSCCKIEPVCHGLVNDAAKSSQNMEPEAFAKKDGLPLDRPDDAPCPFTILFVGVDKREKGVREVYDELRGKLAGAVCSLVSMA